MLRIGISRSSDKRTEADEDASQPTTIPLLKGERAGQIALTDQTRPRSTTGRSAGLAPDLLAPAAARVPAAVDASTATRNERAVSSRIHPVRICHFTNADSMPVGAVDSYWFLNDFGKPCRVLAGVDDIGGDKDEELAAGFHDLLGSEQETHPRNILESRNAG